MKKGGKAERVQRSVVERPLAGGRVLAKLGMWGFIVLEEEVSKLCGVSMSM